MSAARPAAQAHGGRLYAGTSGFAYADWAPRFYPAGARPADLLRLYAARLPAVELNNTFYQQPGPERIAAWLAQTPADFRFAVKAQRGGSLRALGAAPAEAVGWLSGPYRSFGDRLGAVLLRVPGNVARDDVRLAALLEAWPPVLPLVVEFQHPSWHEPEVLDLLRRSGASACLTDLDDRPLGDEPIPDAGLVYARLRRTSYSAAELGAWAERLRPPLSAGRDCYVFFRHDADGVSAQRALYLLERAGQGVSSRGG